MSLFSAQNFRTLTGCCFYYQTQWQFWFINNFIADLELPQKTPLQCFDEYFYIVGTLTKYLVEAVVNIFFAYFIRGGPTLAIYLKLITSLFA